MYGLEVVWDEKLAIDVIRMVTDGDARLDCLRHLGSALYSPQFADYGGNMRTYLLIRPIVEHTFAGDLSGCQ